MQAIWQVMSETSKRSIRLAPLSPASKRRHVVSTPQPSGVTIPRPVTTTRLMGIPGLQTTSAVPRADPAPGHRHHTRTSKDFGRPDCFGQSALGIFLEEFDRIAHGENGLGRVVGNLATELL